LFRLDEGLKSVQRGLWKRCHVGHIARVARSFRHDVRSIDHPQISLTSPQCQRNKLNQVTCCDVPIAAGIATRCGANTNVVATPAAIKAVDTMKIRKF
jgi:hypothetical protein